MLSTAWQLWVVENLAAGATSDQVVSALASQGVPQETARAQVAEVRADPAFRRLLRRAWRGRHAERIATMLADLAGPQGVDVHDDLPPEAVLDRYWSRCRPVKLRTMFSGLRALRTWTWTGLAERFGGATVQVSADRGRDVPRSAKEAAQQHIPWPELLQRVHGPPSDSVYLVARSGLLHDPQFATLAADLAPLPAMLDPRQVSTQTGVWIGPAGTHTVAHFDPHTALLLQIRGRKAIRLAPPTVGSLAEDSDGWFTNHDLTEPALEGVATEIELGEGEALLVPAGWWHEVDALEPSITVSFLGFVWPNDFHWIGPPGRT